MWAKSKYGSTLVSTSSTALRVSPDWIALSWRTMAITSSVTPLMRASGVMVLAKAANWTPRLRASAASREKVFFIPGLLSWLGSAGGRRPRR